MTDEVSAVYWHCYNLFIWNLFNIIIGFLNLFFNLFQEKKPYVDKAAELKAEYDKALESNNVENDVRSSFRISVGSLCFIFLFP